MTTYLRDDAPEDEGGSGLILALFVAGILSLLLWAGLIYGVLWLASRPAEFWIVGFKLALLLLGTALVCYSLAQIERESR